LCCCLCCGGPDNEADARVKAREAEYTSNVDDISQKRRAKKYGNITE